MPSLPTLLRRHPFPVVAWFERVVAISFAFPTAIMRSLVPNGLEIDEFNGFGFVTVAMVWTRTLRPAGFPAFLGQDFFLSGYRVFTTLRDESGRRLRGLNILRSETDRHRMVWMGNLMTHYNYRHVHMRLTEAGTRTRVQTFLPDGKPALDLTFESPESDTSLPEGSPFPNWRSARRFAGPMPFTFTAESDGNFVVIEGSRQNWKPHPVHVLEWRVALFEESPLRGTTPILANAFAVEDVAYRWKRGRIVRPGDAT